MEWRLAAFVGGAVASPLLTALLPPTLRRLGLERTNFRGRTILTGAGVCFLVVCLPWLWLPVPPLARIVAVTALVFGVLGVVDDRWGTAEHKGIRGHLRALRQGRVTTGLLKAVGGLLTAAVAAWLLRPGLFAIPTALLIALTANLFNLLDLRPLRTLKAFWALGVLAAPFGPAPLVALLGSSWCYARMEARRVVMLGDTGANCLGAAVGCTLAVILPPAAIVAGVLALVAFHGWAERHSFTEWISRHAWAKRIDEWGWRQNAEG
jgi:UDP-N-acetylmuramyl pentapeptide phosphotransferase/UDP-N-acetylglucosamine-1-phosphate transferase